MSVRSQLIAVPRPKWPRVQRAVLRRPESTGEPLVFLVAPSGFGKTSLLAGLGHDGSRAGCMALLALMAYSPARWAASGTLILAGIDDLSCGSGRLPLPQNAPRGAPGALDRGACW